MRRSRGEKSVSALITSTICLSVLQVFIFLLLFLNPHVCCFLLAGSFTEWSDLETIPGLGALEGNFSPLSRIPVCATYRSWATHSLVGRERANLPPPQFRQGLHNRRPILVLPFRRHFPDADPSLT